MAEQAFGALNPKKAGFFGKPPVQEQAPPLPMQSELTNISRRLKILEERHENTRRHINFLEQNMQDMQKRLSDELKTSKWEIGEMHKAIKDMQDKQFLIIKEIKLTASKDEVEILKKYLHLWEPLNFLTRSQVEKITKELLDELGIYR